MSGFLTLAVVGCMIWIAVKLTKLCERFEQLENTIICTLTFNEVPPDDKEPWER